MEIAIGILVVVALIAFAVYEQKWKPLHQPCPKCGAKQYGRYLVDAELCKESDIPEDHKNDEEYKDYLLVARYQREVLHKDPVSVNPVKVTTHCRCKACGEEGLTVTYSHDEAYRIGTGFHDARWGRKVYDDRAVNAARNALER